MHILHNIIDCNVRNFRKYRDAVYMRGKIMSVRNRQKIMLVDDNQATLAIGKNMLQDHYEVYAVPSAERLFAFLKAVTPELILMDVSMPDMSGFEVIKMLKNNALYADIPVIFVTSRDQESEELEGLALGAVDYVTKPFSSAILMKRIETHLLIRQQATTLKEFNDNLVEMVKKKTSQITRMQNTVISTFAEIIEFRDTVTGDHIKRTQEYMRLLLNRLIYQDNIYFEEILTWENMDAIVASSQLHDVGKICISDAILNKPGKLTPEEFDIMKTHAAKGVEMIRKMKNGDIDDPFLKYAEIIAGAHHEKWDGSGYPAGLKGQDIPLLGRLMAIVDVYDALTSARPYKRALTPEEAAQIIIKASGTHFDPVLVAIFMELEDTFGAVARDDQGSGVMDF